MATLATGNHTAAPPLPTEPATPSEIDGQADATSVVVTDDACELTEEEQAGAILSAYNHVSKRVPLPWLKSARILVLLEEFDAFGTARKEQARAVGTVVAAKAAVSDIKEAFTDLNKHATEIAINDLGWLAPPERPKKKRVVSADPVDEVTEAGKKRFSAARGTTDEKLAAPKRPRSVAGMRAYMAALKADMAAATVTLADGEVLPAPPK